MPRSGLRIAQRRRPGSSSDAQRQHLASRYLLPQPRNALAEAVRAHASAAMDVSDGLAGDFAKLCRVSRVAAEIEVARVPLSEAAKAVLAAEPAMLETALTGGDDYEIVCTVPAAKADGFRAAAKAAGVAVTEIGENHRRRGRPLSRPRTASRSPSSAPHSAISEIAGTRAAGRAYNEQTGSGKRHA